MLDCKQAKGFEIDERDMLYKEERNRIVVVEFRNLSRNRRYLY